MPQKYQAWVDARRKFKLSHAHVQMARELGMNPKKLGGLASHRQELWKAPLPEFIEDLYFKQFGKDKPDEVLSVEALFERQRKKKEERKAQKAFMRIEIEANEADDDPF